MPNTTVTSTPPLFSDHVQTFLMLILSALFWSYGVAAEEPVEALFEAGHWKRARTILETRLKSNPNDAQAAHFLSRIKLVAGDLEGAQALAERATNVDGKNASFRIQLAHVYGKMAQKASVFKQFGLARRCRKEMEAALANDPNHLDSLLFQMHFLWAAPGIIGGDKARARQIPERMVQISPVQGYLAHAELALEANEPGKLEDLYMKAIRADPRSYEARVELGELYYHEPHKKYESAEKQAQEALKIDAGRARAYNILTAVYARQQRSTEMEAVLAQAAKNVPDNLVPFYVAGDVLLSVGKDLARAETYFRKYLSQEPELNAPSLATARWRLGLVLEKQGRKHEAITELESALRLDPHHGGAKGDLRRIKG